jgi:hypothetical protein
MVDMYQYLGFLDKYLSKHKWWRVKRGLPEPYISPVIDMITKEALRMFKQDVFEMTETSAFNNKGVIKVRMPHKYERKH